jgi:mannose-6-phosphate isomerase class I
MRWGAIQLIELQYEVASMRKQIGELWELSAENGTDNRISKRINELTAEIELRDTLLADVSARQGFCSFDDRRV